MSDIHATKDFAEGRSIIPRKRPKNSAGSQVGTKAPDKIR